MDEGDGRSRCVLYMTLGCHLCEQAEQLIWRATGVQVQTVDIADDPVLLDRYGVRIPVLHRLDTGQELNWSFDAHAVRELLAEKQE